MLKKTITFKDLDGNDITEEFYFGLSKAELAEMSLSTDGGYEEYLETVAKNRNSAEMVSAFKEIIGRTVGRKSEDNRRFEKSDEITRNFMHTDAYSVLFMELATDAGRMVEFIKAVMPSDLADKIDSSTLIPKADGIKSLEDFTEEELLNMSQENFDALVGRDPNKMKREHLIIAMKRKTLSK